MYQIIQAEAYVYKMDVVWLYEKSPYAMATDIAVFPPDLLE